MKRFMIAAALLCAAAAPAPALASDALFIKSIVESGLNGCDDDMPESFGTRIYRNVQKICAGRESCRLAPKSAKKFGCTSLFVIFKCSNGVNQEVSASVNKTLTLQCE